LCQENTTKSLHYPGESKRNTQGAGYKTIGGLPEGFSTAGYLPRTITLGDGEGVEGSTKLSGMIPVGFNIIEQNCSRQKKERHLWKVPRISSVILKSLSV